MRSAIKIQNRYKIGLIFLIFIASGCNHKAKKANASADQYADSLIQFKDLSNKELLLTSNNDYNSLILLVPIEISINKAKNEKIFDLTIYAQECDNPSKISYYPIYYKKDYFLPFRPEDINERLQNNPKLKIYRRFLIEPDKDSLATSFSDEMKFIKANCRKANNYFNDTIKYKGISELRKKHNRYFENRFANTCDLIVADVMIKKGNSFYESKGEYKAR